MSTRILWFILLLFSGIASSAWAAEYIQIAGLIDTRTTHSDGALSVAELGPHQAFRCPLRERS